MIFTTVVWENEKVIVDFFFNHTSVNLTMIGLKHESFTTLKLTARWMQIAEL